MKKKVTFEQFNKLCELTSKFEHQPHGWYPTVKDINKYIIPEPQKYLLFMTWLIENNPLPTTKEEKESYDLINKIMRENIRIID